MKLKSLLPLLVVVTVMLGGLVSPNQAQTFSVSINFQDETTTPPAGYLKDFGEPYGLRSGADQGSGQYTYGWISPTTGDPANLVGQGRNRTVGQSDLRLATLVHMDHPSTPPVGYWQISVPNGTYDIEVAVGEADAGSDPENHRINAEGVNIIAGFVPSGADGSATRHTTATGQVTVTDGTLTLDYSGGGLNTKLNHVIITAAGSVDPTPYIVDTVPTDGATNVSVTTSVATTQVISFNPDDQNRTGIDNTTITNSTVYLYPTAQGASNPVPATVNGTGGGDSISLSPATNLQPFTQYTFVVDGVFDLGGFEFEYYEATFTTGADDGGGPVDVEFEQASSGATPGGYGSVQVYGNRLYAVTISGDGMFHWDINPTDGTLSNETNFNPGNVFNGRAMVGLAIDPRSTESDPIIWVTSNAGSLSDSPNFTGKIYKVEGSSVGTGSESWTATEMVDRLPRSKKDHLSNSLAFGPDGALYLIQGSITAMGAPDNAWGQRNETLLSAALLRIDVGLLESYFSSNGVLDVYTGPYGFGNPNLPYDPQAAGAPLTVYATGIRNAYDVVWHSNGNAYIPTNGSASGGNSPSYPAVAGTGTGESLNTDDASYDSADEPPELADIADACFNRLDDAINGDYTAPNVPQINNHKTQRDYLFRVPLGGGGYYGHPNPTRCEWVLNGGNPTSNFDPGEPIGGSNYAVGVDPDRNYQGFAFDFENNKSPNGVIEYQSNVFNGALQGKLLVVRYSSGDDIIILTPGGDGDIVESEDGSDIFGNFSNPLDITEDTSNGNLYVIEYPGQITLLRPVGSQVTPEPEIVVDTSRRIFEQITSAGAGDAQTVTINNIGTDDLTVTLSLTGADDTQFALSTNAFTIPGGQSNSVDITFDPSSNGPKVASLQISSNDADEALLNVELRGLGKEGLGGSNEPSLQWILDTLDLSVDVGDTDDSSNTINLPSGTYNDLLGDEIEAQLFQRAVDAPVTVEVLAVYGPTGNNPVTAFGWYPASNPGNLTEILEVTNNPSSNGQSLLPPIVGATSFDPGTQPFGIFSRWPAFSNRLLFQQDSLNTFSGAIPSHVRVYEHPTESNAYIVATEEHVSGFDYQDIVVIVRNVQPVVAASGIVRLENRDWLWPGNADDAGREHFDAFMTFSNITSGTSSPRVHDQATLRIHNDSTTDTLTITGLNFLNNTNNNQSQQAYDLPNGEDGSLPITVAPGSFEDVVIEFIYAPTNNGNNEVVKAELEIVTSGGTVTMGLGGAWQRQSESGAEPNVAEIADAFGFTTTILGPGDVLNNEGRIETIGEEVLSPFWRRADESRPVYVRQLAAYHSCCNNTATVFYQPNIATGGTNSIFTHNGVDAQSLLPLISGSSGNPAEGTFTPPNEFFGFKIDPEWSDPSRNNKGPDDCSGGLDTCGHHVRFWPARDYTGEIIPNAFLMVMDYSGINYDFNDNVYYISNVQPQNEQTDVTVSVEAWSANLTVNEAFSYDITASNNTIVQASDVVVEQTIPSGFTVNSATFGSESCTVANNTLTCDIGDLNPDVDVIIEVNVTPTQQGAVTADATITTSTPESDSTNNSDSVSAVVVDPNNIPGTITVVLDDTTDSDTSFSYTLGTDPVQPFTLSDDGTTQTGTPIEINFQVDTTPISGFTPDIGLPYADRGNGLTYGWLELGPANDPYTGTGVDSSGAGTQGGSRDRDDLGTLESTLNHMQRNDCCDSGFLTPQYWEIELPNGTYEVNVSVGDPDTEGESGAQHIVNAEGVLVVDSGPVAQGEVAAAQGTVTVTVSDGRLTLDPIGGFNTKIKWVTITPILPTNNTIVFENVLPGTYTVAQELLSGYQLTQLTCEDPSDNTNINLGTLSADVVLDSDEDIVCTFVNAPVQTAGTITIVQESDPDSPQLFNFTGGLGLFSLADNGSTSNSRTFNLPAGTYDITQAAVSNWTLDNIVCDSGTVNLGLRTATVELVSGDVTCTFSNTKLNTPPVIAAIPQQNVIAGQTVSVNISAPDDDPSDTVSISISILDGQSNPVAPSEYSFSDNGNSTASFSWVTDAADVGVYYATVTASDGQGNDTEEFVIAISPEPVLTDAVCYNSGYTGTVEFTASDGRVFLPDAFNTGGRVWPEDGQPKSGEAIAGTTDDFIYQTEYSSGTDLQGFSYNIPIENGTYTVDLYFAEIYFGANSTPSGPGGANQRVFGYDIEGGQVSITGYDINAAVGAATADIESYPGIVVSDGTLNIDFSATVNQPKISALCIVPEAEPGNTPPIVAPVSPVTLPAGTTLQIPVSASDIDNDDLTLMATVVDGSDAPLNSSSFNDNGDGTGVLTLTPAIGTEGSYTGTIIADDGEATSIYSFSVTVTESSVTVNGTLTLQGRSDHSGDVRVRIYETGTSNLLQESTISVDAAGSFTLTGLDAGTVDIAVKASNSLQNIETVTLVAGDNSVDMGELLAGDANDDNSVNVFDLPILKAAFGSTQGDAAYNAQADFNGDGNVNVFDLPLIKSNFNTNGEEPGN